MKTKSLSLATALLVFLGATTVQADGHANHDLDAALSSQSEEAKARYGARHPKETIEFFGIEPGMKIAEALPGGGWYTKILLPYLGKEGQLVGIDYSIEMWPNFGGFATEEFMEKKKTWASTWTAEATQWAGEKGASVSAATFSTMPEEMSNSLDAVLFVRALHNLSRFEGKGGYMTSAIAETFRVLKPGGIVGVVQHEARADRPDEWANGSNGYLKKAAVISAMESAGFEFVADSDINANDRDQAVEGDFVWRLPPSLNGAKDDEELKAKRMAIGESHRMTLKFVKPAS